MRESTSTYNAEYTEEFEVGESHPIELGAEDYSQVSDLVKEGFWLVLSMLNITGKSPSDEWGAFGE